MAISIPSGGVTSETWARLAMFPLQETACRQAGLSKGLERHSAQGKPQAEKGSAV
jgi:hypothetical protein